MLRLVLRCRSLPHGQSEAGPGGAGSGGAVESQPRQPGESHAAPLGVGPLTPAAIHAGAGGADRWLSTGMSVWDTAQTPSKLIWGVQYCVNHFINETLSPGCIEIDGI